MKSSMGETGENAGPHALRDRVRCGWQGQGVTAPARAGRAVRRRWLCGLITACALTLGSGSTGHAFDFFAFREAAFNYWTDVIDSYWWPDPRARKASNDVDPWDLQAHRLLPGETEPVGLVTALNPFFQPSRRDGATCEDFRVVTYSEVARREIGNFPFRRHQGKSTVYVGVLGTLPPRVALMWVAAMLPEGAEPLFDSDGVGLNPDVLSRRFLDQAGEFQVYTRVLPPEELRLISVTQCDGFEIYLVEFGR